VNDRKRRFGPFATPSAMTAICAQWPAGVDVNRTSPVGAVDVTLSGKRTLRLRFLAKALNNSISGTALLNRFHQNFIEEHSVYAIHVVASYSSLSFRKRRLPIVNSYGGDTRY